MRVRTREAENPKDGEEMASQARDWRGDSSPERVHSCKRLEKQIPVQKVKGPITHVGDFKPLQVRVVHVRPSAGKGYCCR